MDLILETVLHHYPGKRVVAAATLSGEPVVAKFFGGWRQYGEYRRSVRGSRILERSGVPTARLHAARRAPEELRAEVAAAAPEAQLPEPVWVAVFERLEGEAPWPPSTEPLDERAHLWLLRTLAHHHAAGLVQNDLNWTNFIPQGEALVAVDTDRVRRSLPARLLGRPIGRGAALRHLVRMYASKSRIPENAVREGLHAYLAERGWEADDGEEARFLDRVRRARSHHAHAVAARGTRGWKHYPRHRHAQGWIHYDRRHVREADARAAANRLHAEGLPHDRNGLRESGRLWRVHRFPAARPVLLPSGWAQRWAAARAARQARACWRTLLVVRRLGFAVERPLVLATDPLRDAWLLQEAGNAAPLSQALRSNDRTELARCLGMLRHTLGWMRALGVGHRRWHADALGWDGERIQLLDPVGLRVERPARGPTRFPSRAAERRWLTERRTLAEALAPMLEATPDEAEALLTASAGRGGN